MSVETAARHAFLELVAQAATAEAPVPYPINQESGIVLLIPNEPLDGKRRDVLLDSYDLLCVIVRNGMADPKSYAHELDDEWYRGVIHRPVVAIVAAMNALGQLTPAEEANRAMVARYT